MFPLVPVPPTCREAWIVCMADKWCALCETVAGRLPRKGEADDGLGKDSIKGIREGAGEDPSKDSSEKRRG